MTLKITRKILDKKTFELLMIQFTAVLQSMCIDVLELW